MSQKNDLPENVNELLVPSQHARIQLIDANETYLFAGRGSFKSSVGGGLFNIRRVFEMPRSTGVGVGISFNNLYENTLPPLKAFLLSKGFIEDVHFTVCKPPPANWPKPYLGVVDKTYKNTMTWYNGTSKQFISLHRKASANGVSAQWGDFDEVKFMDETELVDEIFPIFRGNEKYFKNCSGYLSKFFMTDKNADPAQLNWLLNKRDMVNPAKVDIVISLALKLEKLKQLYNQVGKTKQAELAVEINAIEVRLAVLRSNMVYVSEISIDDVRPIMGNRWYKDKQRNTKTYLFNTIYKNQDPDRPENTFYPSWESKKILYDIANDIDPDKPLIIASDYQHSVAPISVAQLSKLPNRDKVSLNYVDNLYTLHPEGLRLAVAKFCDRFKDHRFKQVYYVYDHTAIGERVDADSYCNIVINELREHGWIVHEVPTGQAPDHYQKYLDTKDWMDHKDEDTMEIMINVRCKKLIKSITGAGAYTVGKRTKKDKRGEINDKLDQSETTHFSDTFDMINDAVLKKKLISEVVDYVPMTLR